MKLEIAEVVDKGDRIVLKLEYDWEFAAMIAKALDINYPSEEDIETIVTMILENMSLDDLGELGDQIDE